MSNYPAAPVHEFPSQVELSAWQGENFVQGKTLYVASDNLSLPFHALRTLALALGAKAVYNKMMQGVDLLLSRGLMPSKATSKYPEAALHQEDELLALALREFGSFPDVIQGLRQRGFTVRNPSDEGDPNFDFFSFEPISQDLGENLLHYLQSSPFIEKTIHAPYFPIDRQEETFFAVDFPTKNLRWWVRWQTSAWSRVSATRGEGPYPMEISGGDMLLAQGLFYRAAVGLQFYEYPHSDSIDGLFIQAGFDVRSGLVTGMAISRVWT